jgi:hypothetical protein
MELHACTSNPSNANDDDTACCPPSLSQRLQEASLQDTGLMLASLKLRTHRGARSWRIISPGSYTGGSKTMGNCSNWVVFFWEQHWCSVQFVAWQDSQKL